MEKKNTNNVQEYFEAMVKDITINKISLQQFFEYYNNLKNAVASQLVKEPLNYLLALSNAEVFPITTYDDEEKFSKISEEIRNSVASITKKRLEGKVDLKNYFDKMINIINIQRISFRDFSQYYEMLELAIMAKAENIDLVSCATTLLNAEVEATKTYDQDVKLNNYRKKLTQYILTLEKQSQHKSK